MVGAKHVRLAVSDKLLDDGRLIGLLRMASEGGLVYLCNAYSGRAAEIGLWC